jgi:hypothetical protein
LLIFVHRTAPPQNTSTLPAAEHFFMAAPPVVCQQLVYDSLSSRTTVEQHGDELWLGPCCQRFPRGIHADVVHVRTTDAAGCYSPVLREVLLSMMEARPTEVYYYDARWDPITQEQAHDSLRRSAEATTGWKSVTRPARLARLYEEGPD